VVLLVFVRREDVDELGSPVDETAHLVAVDGSGHDRLLA
jgi:hypothetical protein